MARPDFRAVAARRLSEDRELSPAIVSLITSENAGRTSGVKVLSIDRIESNPDQPRMVFDEDALHELSASTASCSRSSSDRSARTATSSLPVSAAGARRARPG